MSTRPPVAVRLPREDLHTSGEGASPISAGPFEMTRYVACDEDELMIRSYYLGYLHYNRFDPRFGSKD